VTRLLVHLPDEQRAFIDAKVAAGICSDSSDYLSMLIGDAMRAEKKAALVNLLAERIDAVDNGDADEMTTADWKRLREEFTQQHRASQAKKHGGKAADRKTKTR